MGFRSTIRSNFLVHFFMGQFVSWVPKPLLTSGPPLFSSKLVPKNNNKELILKIIHCVLEIQCDKVLFLWKEKFVSWVPKSLYIKIPNVKMVQNNENKEKKIKILRWVSRYKSIKNFGTFFYGWWVPEALDFRIPSLSVLSWYQKIIIKK